MMYGGIDPGARGAIAIIEPDTGFSVVHDMPTYETATGKTRVDAGGLSRILNAYRDEQISFVVEWVSAMPKQGAASTFAFGEAFGVAKGSVAWIDPSFHLVAPRVWKRHYKLTSDKEEARLLAMQLFPARAYMLRRKKDDGRAEALLLAHYAATIACVVETAAASQHL